MTLCNRSLFFFPHKNGSFEQPWLNVYHSVKLRVSAIAWLFRVLDVLVARFAGVGASGIECRATVATFIQLCSNVFAYRVWCAKQHAHFLGITFFSPNRQSRRQALDFPFSRLIYILLSDMKLRACTFQCNHSVYISLLVGNAKRKKRNHIGSANKLCHSIFASSPNSGHECMLITLVLFLWSVCVSCLQL